MRYAEARPLIRSGDLIATTHRKWRSLYDLQVQGVQTFTQSPFAHVALVAEWGERLWVIEAVQPLVRVVPLSHFADDGFWWVGMDTPMTEAETAHALAKVGRARYSKWQAIRAYFGALRIGEDDFAECAELVIECRRKSGVDLGDIATPKAVMQAALDLDKAQRYVRGA